MIVKRSVVIQKNILDTENGMILTGFTWYYFFYFINSDLGGGIIDNILYASLIGANDIVYLQK